MTKSKLALLATAPALALGALNRLFQKIRSSYL